MRALVFLVEGFEEIEAVTIINVLRRGGVEAKVVSLTGKREVEGGRGITVLADTTLDGLDSIDNSILVLPGGPGTHNYMKHEIFLELIKMHNADGGHIAAICAAPTVLGQLGLLRDKAAVCFPSPFLLDKLNAREVPAVSTITDGNTTTANGPAASLDFALEVLRIATGDVAKVSQVAENMLLC
jgi:4-methyl-5(b-hydroxyethyl)-thiazole monophosphate biosynthesis